MTVVIDLKGLQFGNLIVIGRDGVDSRGEARWICHCGCGKTVKVLGSNLRNGRQKSCGCKKRLPSGQAAFNHYFRNIKKNARQRGYEWALSEENVRELCQQPCYYCGREPSQILERIDWNGEFIYNGLDRVDNLKDYTIENVVPCCKTCNYAKKTMDIGEFRNWIRQIYHHWASED